MKSRLAIIITHPSRYIIPLVQVLVRRNIIEVKVFFTYGPELLKQKGYSKEYRDKHETAVPLYNNYDFEFVENTAKEKTIKKFSGINNPELISKISEYQPDVILINGWKFRSHLKVMKHFSGIL